MSINHSFLREEKGEPKRIEPRSFCFPAKRLTAGPHRLTKLDPCTTAFITCDIYVLLQCLREMPTAVVWSGLPFIRSGQNHLAGQSERGKKTRQTEEEVGRQHQGMDRSGVRQVPEGSGKQGKMEKTGCKIICGAPMILAVKGLMMIMMMTVPLCLWLIKTLFNLKKTKNRQNAKFSRESLRQSCEQY